MPARHPILHDVPQQLDTERLILRCPRAGDGAAVHEAVVESLPQLREFGASLPWAMAEPSVDSSEVFCRQGEADYLARTNLPLLMYLKSNGRFVGGSGLHRFSWVDGRFEIGWWCRSSLSGRGYVTEAVNAITAFAFERLQARRVEAFPDDLNLASCRVCERAGYALEGVLRHERIGPDGVMRNTRVYAKVR